jgi:hypothetical protein
MFTDLKIHNSFTLENSFFKTEQEPGTTTEATKCHTEATLASPTKVDNSDDSEESSSCEESSEDSFSYLPSGEAHDKRRGYHHFTQEDHVKLGVDLAHTLHKVYYRPMA